ncbi:MAG: hypothetical protein IIC67_05280 [Thaumarchaeota archaeon]|nr:hypothetical protein [Nitrososphaerota archaeon]
MSIEEFNLDLEACSENDFYILRHSIKNYYCGLCKKGYKTKKYFGIHLKFKHRMTVDTIS